MKLTLALLLVFSASLAQALQEVRNGGAGIVADGGFMTFYDAHIPVVPRALQPAEIPGFQYLLDQVQNMALVPDVHLTLINAILPTEDRGYFLMDQSKMDPKQMKQILEKYTQATPAAPNSLALLAVTSPFLTSTVLFPDFFLLKTDAERAAILLHESAWLFTDIDYQTMVLFEMAAQAYFEHGPTDPEIYYEFYYRLSKLFYGDDSGNIIRYACLEHDLKAKMLVSPGLPSGKVFLKDIYGQSFLKCIANATADNEDACNIAFRLDILAKVQKNSNLLFLKSLSQNDYFSFSLDFGGLSLADFNSNKLYVDFTNSAGSAPLSFFVYQLGSKWPVGTIFF